ncbi:hypothetical protein CSIRO_3474 [Bradyrhizobiaceae bacterium SG-6C]|nr:hypothetical protein CSIRO_3474 [Bradyrhizobiaceae bacterium SG-6C]
MARGTRIGALRRPGTGSATKQSTWMIEMDCFAALAMTE